MSTWDFMQLVGASLVGALAVFFDLKWRRIPNWLTFTAMIYGIVIHLWFEELHWETPFYGIGIGLLAFVPFFIMGGIGAGDVKCTMGIGAILGPKMILWTIVFTAVSGGVISLMRMVREYGVQETAVRFWLTIATVWGKKNRKMPWKRGDNRLTIPYGVAIFWGLVITVGIRLYFIYI